MPVPLAGTPTSAKSEMGIRFPERSMRRHFTALIPRMPGERQLETFDANPIRCLTVAPASRRRNSFNNPPCFCFAQPYTVTGLRARVRHLARGSLDHDSPAILRFYGPPFAVGPLQTQ